MRPRTRRPPAPHVPQPDPDAPCTCHCGLRLDVPNSRHIAPADLPDNPGAELDARRLGERDSAEADT